ncbi:MAG: hypothetical protein M1834_009524 [Cirrosporium novae-zelandiae]|nr:MAG: hypothetical protein M1834_009524 [Cirrosporium novae-zelandiae]
MARTRSQAAASPLQKLPTPKRRGRKKKDTPTGPSSASSAEPSFENPVGEPSEPVEPIVEETASNCETQTETQPETPEIQTQIQTNTPRVIYLCCPSCHHKGPASSFEKSFEDPNKVPHVALPKRTTGTSLAAALLRYTPNTSPTSRMRDLLDDIPTVIERRRETLKRRREYPESDEENNQSEVPASKRLRETPPPSQSSPPNNTNDPNTSTSTRFPPTSALTKQRDRNGNLLWESSILRRRTLRSAASARKVLGYRQRESINDNTDVGMADGTNDAGNVQMGEDQKSTQVAPVAETPSASPPTSEVFAAPATPTPAPRNGQSKIRAILGSVKKLFGGERRAAVNPNNVPSTPVGQQVSLDFGAMPQTEPSGRVIFSANNAPASAGPIPTAGSRQAKKPQKAFRSKEEMIKEENKRIERDFIESQIEFTKKEQARRAIEREELAKAEEIQKTGSKRKRITSPEVIPNPPGCSYGMWEDYFDESSDDGETPSKANGNDTVPTNHASAVGTPKSARKNDDPESIRPSKKARVEDCVDENETSPRNRIGDPKRAAPYTGTMFADPSNRSLKRDNGKNLFDQAATVNQTGQQVQGQQVREGQNPPDYVPPPVIPNKSGTFELTYSDDSDDEELSPERGSSSTASQPPIEEPSNPITAEPSTSSTKESNNLSTEEPSKWTQPPPPRPTPAHATLPSANPAVTPENDALAKKRAEIMKHRSRRPSALSQYQTTLSPVVEGGSTENTPVHNRHFTRPVSPVKGGVDTWKKALAETQPKALPEIQPNVLTETQPKVLTETQPKAQQVEPEVEDSLASNEDTSPTLIEWPTTVLKSQGGRFTQEELENAQTLFNQRTPEQIQAADDDFANDVRFYKENGRIQQAA